MTKDLDRLYNSFFERFIPTIIENSKNGGGRWPMPIFEQSFSVSNFSSPIIVREFMSKVQELNADGVTDVQIGQKYYYPSQLARFQHMFAGRYLWQDSNDPIVAAHKFVSILSTMYKNNLFCQDGQNIIYTEQELTDKYSKYLDLSDKRITLEIAKLEKLLYLLVESYSPRFVNSHFEFSGPYKVQDKWLVVKEYHDLRPNFIPIKFGYNFDKITIINIYNQAVDYKVDIMCRPLASNQNLPLPLRSLLFIQNQAENDAGKVTQYCEQITATMQQSVIFLSSLTTKEDIVRFNTNLEFLTALSPIINNNKQLVDEAVANFYNPDFQTRSERFNSWMKSIPKDDAGWRRIFDPRIKITI